MIRNAVKFIVKGNRAINFANRLICNHKALSAVKFPRNTLHNNISCAIQCRRFSSEPQQYEFQAETRKLLDIVTHSIYTDKEVFIRELVSNASDALEKRRYNQVVGGGQDTTQLEINILTDQTNKTLTISDNGIGKI